MPKTCLAALAAAGAPAGRGSRTPAADHADALENPPRFNRGTTNVLGAALR